MTTSLRGLPGLKFRHMIDPLTVARNVDSSIRLREQMSSLLWRNSENNVGEQYSRERISNPFLSNLLFDVDMRCLAWETTSPTDEMWDMVRGVAEDSLDQLDIYRLAHRIRYHTSLLPLSEMLAVLLAGGVLGGAKLVDLRMQYDNSRGHSSWIEFGRILSDGVLITRESTSRVQLLKACVEHGAHALAFVQRVNEGLPLLLDSAENIRRFQKTPLEELYKEVPRSSLRLSVYDFGSVENVELAVDRFSRRGFRDEGDVALCA